MSAPTIPVDAVHKDEHERELVRVYVWDLVVRATHWTIAFSIVILAITGYYIGKPFVSNPGEAGRWFTTGTVRVVHYYAAIAFTIAVLTRIGWMFMGHHWARWRELLPVEKHRLKGLFQTAMFYAGLRREPALGAGHNPLAGLSYLGVFCLYLVMIATGFGLAGVDGGVSGWFRFFRPLATLFGGPQLTRWIHHVTMWLLLVFVVQHVMAALLTTLSEKNGTMDSIFSGFKWISREQVQREKERWRE